MARQAAVAGPRIESFELRGLTDGTAVDATRDEIREAWSFADLELSGQDLNSRTFEECAFRNLRADGTEWRGSRFVRCEFNRLDAPVLSATRCTLRNVRFVSCRIGAAEMYDSEWDSVEFHNCRIGFVNLRASRVTDVRFSGCRIDELDAGSLVARRMTFDDTSVDVLRLHDARLTDVDLRSAVVAAVAGVSGLSGVTMSTTQAELLGPDMARELGVRLES